MAPVPLRRRLLFPQTEPPPEGSPESLLRPFRALDCTPPRLRGRSRCPRPSALLPAAPPSRRSPGGSPGTKKAQQPKLLRGKDRGQRDA